MKEANYPAIILFGNPGYYKRFGFVNAEKFRITTKDYKNFDAFMALELFENSLKILMVVLLKAMHFQQKIPILNLKNYFHIKKN